MVFPWFSHGFLPGMNSGDFVRKDVVFRETGTDTVPNASPTAASASSDIYGWGCPVNPWENHGKTRKTPGKTMENPGKTLEEWFFIGEVSQYGIISG